MADIVNMVGESLTIKEMSEEIERQMKENFAYQNFAVNYNELSAEAKKDLDYKINEIIESMKKLMITEQAAKAVSDILEDKFTEVDTSEKVRWDGSEKGIKNALSSIYGDFTENMVFDLSSKMKELGYGRNEAKPDIQSIFGSEGVEAKLTRGARDLLVGQVTVEGFSSKEEFKSNINKNIVKIYKMMIKMRHFLLMKITEDVQMGVRGGQGRVRIHFDEMTLYTELIIKKLIEYVESSQVISIETPSASFKADRSGDLTYKGTYVIKLTLSPASIIKIKKMYFIEIDYISQIRNDSDFRAMIYLMLEKEGLHKLS